MKLQILTVSYFSYDLLQLNQSIFDKLNSKEIDYEWHILDNSTREDNEVSGLIYHDGHQHKVDPIRIDRMKLGCGSVHHGLGMNLGRQYLDQSADMWLIMDPDFYLIVPIHDLIQFITEEDYWIFGAQYVNTRKNLIKDFPCLFCMFLNPKHIKKDDLDFSVGYIGEDDKAVGYYPDAGYKIMYSLSRNPNCKYGTFQSKMDNVYRIGKQKVGIHLRAKMDKLGKYLHGREQHEEINLKARLKEAKYFARDNENGKISIPNIRASLSI